MRSVEIKVGLFMVVALAVLAGLILRFGGFYRGAGNVYQIHVIFPNVGGIVRDAAVMYAGIPVGKVVDIQLTEGRILEVRVTLAIRRGVVIREDAKFVVNQSGLLGDRYVDVLPGTATADPLRPGAIVHGTTSVDLSEAIRSVVDVLRRTAGTIERVDQILQRLDATVLGSQTLDHASATIANIDAASTNTVALLASLQAVVEENRAHVTETLGKFESAATSLSHTARRVDDLVVANQDDIRAAVKNLADSTARVEGILARLEQGEGTAGKLLVDPTLHDELVRLIQNWRQFGLLYKEKSPPRQRRPNSPLDRSPRGMTPVPARPAEPDQTGDPPR